MSVTSSINRFYNVQQLTESNFNITPSNVDIWHGDIPYKEGDVFPTDTIRNRANEYLTNQQLYKNHFDGILDNVFSWVDYMRNPLTNLPNLAICADLPDWFNTTEAWVSIFSDTPEIDTIMDIDDAGFKETNLQVRKLSSALNNSNFADVWLDIVRSAQIVYGNKAVKISKTYNGGVRLDSLPLKCWQPFVNESNTSVIEANLFYNIFVDQETQQSRCEFIVYIEDGRIVKKTFEYFGNNGNGKLGALISEEEGRAFDGEFDSSPIVIFHGTNIEGSIFGESLFKYWDASISSAIRNFEAIGVLVEQAKEIVRLIPSGATKTDEYTGITYQSNTGSIAYSDVENPPTIEYKKVSVQIDQVIEAYKESIARVSRDTCLPASFFDTRELNIAASGSALKASMYRTEIMANSFASNLKFQLKQLISKIGMACKIDIDDSLWDVTIKRGILTDKTEQSNIIQARIGGVPTMSRAQAIKEYEGVNIDLAIRKAAKLEGQTVEEAPVANITVENGTGDDKVSDNIEFTATENKTDIQQPQVEYPVGVIPL